MARIRSIKPDLWQDEAIGDLAVEARLLFIGLITQADDEGRLRGDPRLIGAQIFPYDAPPPEQVEAWLAELDRAGLILRYAHAGRPLISLPAWERHQKINRPNESPLPGPESEGSMRTHGTITEDSPPDRRGEEGKGKERSGGESEADASDEGETSHPPLPATEEKSVSELPTGGRLSELLADLIAANDPNGKRPMIGKRWLEAERLLVTRDGRQPDQVEAVIRWTQADEFERTVVLSMPKLRQRFGALWQKSQRRGGGVGADLARLEAEKQRLRAEEAMA